MATTWVDFDEVTEKVGMVELLSEFGILSEFRVKGTRISGCCPFPSHPHPLGKRKKSQWSANFRSDLRPPRWLWTCWADCQASGTCVQFVQRMTGLDLAHVRVWFADRAARFGLSLRKPRDDASSAARTRDQGTDGKAQKQERQQTNETAATPDESPKAAAVPTQPSTVSAPASALKTYKPIRFFLDLDRAAALPYLASRGISSAVAEHFGLGIAGAKSKTFCGYVCAPVWTNPPTEFPLGYIGRWPGEPPEGKSRYLLPKNFPSDAVVFNLHGALSSGSGPLIVVESIFSVFWLHQAGYRTAVALLGSALGDGQAKAILDSRRSVVVMLDGDLSGRRGAADAVEKLKRGFVRDVVLDEELQPDHLNSEQLAALLGPLTLFS